MKKEVAGIDTTNQFKSSNYTCTCMCAYIHVGKTCVRRDVVNPPTHRAVDKWVPGGASFHFGHQN